MVGPVKPLIPRAWMGVEVLATAGEVVGKCLATAGAMLLAWLLSTSGVCHFKNALVMIYLYIIYPF